MTHEDIKEQILSDHFGPNRLSYTDLHKKYGWSRTALERLIRQAKQEGREYSVDKVKKVDKRSIEARKPLSGIHVHIGYLVLRHRSEKGQNRQAYGREHGYSSAAIGKIEAGAYDLTLVQMLRFCASSGYTLEELIAAPVSTRVTYKQ